LDQPLIILDTETAGLRGAPHLLELGALRIRGGEIVGRFESLVCPPVEVEEEATDIHGIRGEDVREAPSAAEVVRAFLDWAGEDWLVAHNAPFDARVLAFECRRHRINPSEVPVIDTLALARRHIIDAPSHGLEALCDHLAIEVERHHRALDDALACWGVLRVCLERMGNAAGPARLLADGRPATLANALPPLPRIPRRLRPILDACESGEAITLIYGDSDRQPVPLDVIPSILYRSGDRNYLEAECGASGILKTYRLDRVHAVR
jgi:DNA polymerase III epsilon subunit family exonuclease